MDIQDKMEALRGIAEDMRKAADIHARQTANAEDNKEFARVLNFYAEWLEDLAAKDDAPTPRFYGTIEIDAASLGSDATENDVINYVAWLRERIAEHFPESNITVRVGANWDHVKSLADDPIQAEQDEDEFSSWSEEQWEKWCEEN